MASDPALWVDVPMAGRVTTLARARQDVTAAREHWEAHGFGYWHVWDGAVPDTPPEADAPLLGVGGLRWLRWRDDWVLNVYVRFASAAHGRGLATGMLGLALDRVDQGLSGPTTVVVRTRPGNDRMARLAHRLGFDEAGTEERELGTYRVLARDVGGPRG